MNLEENMKSFIVVTSLITVPLALSACATPKTVVVAPHAKHKHVVVKHPNVHAHRHCHKRACHNHAHGVHHH